MTGPALTIAAAFLTGIALGAVYLGLLLRSVAGFAAGHRLRTLGIGALVRLTGVALVLWMAASLGLPVLLGVTAGFTAARITWARRVSGHHA